MSLASVKTNNPHPLENQQPANRGADESLPPLLQDIDEVMAQRINATNNDRGSDSEPLEARPVVTADREEFLSQSSQPLRTNSSQTTGVDRWAGLPNDKTLLFRSVFKWPPSLIMTKRRLEMIIVVAIIALSAYVWLTRQIPIGTTSDSEDASSYVQTGPTPTSQPEIATSEAAIQEQTRMNSVQAAAQALSHCAATNKPKKYAKPCDSLADLTQNDFFTADPTGISLAVSADQQNAISYTQLTALSLRCEIGSGAMHYFVYRTQTGFYHIECLDQAPTP